VAIEAKAVHLLTSDIQKPASLLHWFKHVVPSLSSLAHPTTAAGTAVAQSVPPAPLKAKPDLQAPHTSLSSAPIMAVKQFTVVIAAVQVNLSLDKANPLLHPWQVTLVSVLIRAAQLVGSLKVVSVAQVKVAVSRANPDLHIPHLSIPVGFEAMQLVAVEAVHSLVSATSLTAVENPIFPQTVQDWPPVLVTHKAQKVPEGLQ
jgi:hypothetical protein